MRIKENMTSRSGMQIGEEQHKQMQAAPVHVCKAKEAIMLL